MNIPKNELQGLLVRGYGKLPEAAFVQLRIGDAASGQVYLEELQARIAPGDSSPDDVALQVAFTYSGLQALGVPADILATFPREFKEGMTDPHRQFVLGDVGYNAPEHWEWGGTATTTVDMMVLIYAADIQVLENTYQQEQLAWTAAGIEETHYLSSRLLPDGKEHFGFKDGISQPVIEGMYGASTSEQRQSLGNPHVSTGEFVLGYPNSYRQYPDTPTVSVADDPDDLLPVHQEDALRKDLGKNGSYLVVRQLSQDVAAFWQYMQEHTQERNAEEQACPVKLAAKMVGRWPNGTPLVQAPDTAGQETEINNEFGYWNEDFRGMKCPVGAHIRRSNPRDWLLTEKTRTDAKEMVDKHKLLRRGRPYGPPLNPTMAVEDLQKANPDGEARGLLFMSFVGDIVRQFEFIQNNWIRFPKFGGGYQENDPLLGPHRVGHPQVEDEFVVPARPVRRRYKQLPTFTELKGGAYFFFPSMTALRYLAKRSTSFSS